MEATYTPDFIPEVGSEWYVVLPGQHVVRKVIVSGWTKRTVELSIENADAAALGAFGIDIGPKYDQERYVTEAVDWVERA